jgi:hypothetical protein
MCGTNLKQFYKKVKFQLTNDRLGPAKMGIFVNVVITELTSAA